MDDHSASRHNTPASPAVMSRVRDEKTLITFNVEQKTEEKKRKNPKRAAHEQKFMCAWKQVKFRLGFLCCSAIFRSLSSRRLKIARRQPRHRVWSLLMFLRINKVGRRRSLKVVDGFGFELMLVLVKPGSLAPRGV